MGRKLKPYTGKNRRLWRLTTTPAVLIGMLIVLCATIGVPPDEQPTETVYTSIPVSETTQIRYTPPTTPQRTLTARDTQERLNRYTQRVESETPEYAIAEPIETLVTTPATTEESLAVETGMSPTPTPETIYVADEPAILAVEPTPETPATATSIERIYTQADIDACALTLSGECYEHETNDKRMVMQVVINRVERGNWGEGFIGVLSAPGQFAGYWRQARPVSDNDIAIATEMLTAWADGAEPIHGYLYFSGGNGTRNVFR